MQIRLYTEYAIWILQYLHVHRDHLQLGVKVAEDIGISSEIFTTIVHRLKEKGLVTSIRGRGFMLGKPAAEISVYDVFSAIEDELRISRNLKNSDDVGKERKIFNAFLQDWQDDMVAKMAGTSIADLTDSSLQRKRIEAPVEEQRANATRVRQKNMKIPATVDYAMRILQYMHENKGGLVKAMEIADATGITYNLVIQIIHRLKIDGLIQTAQGRNGGHMLKKPAHKISVYDVFKCIAGELQIKSRTQEYVGVPVNAGTLQAKNEKLQNRMIAVMSNKSIADLADTKRTVGTDEKENVICQSRRAS